MENTLNNQELVKDFMVEFNQIDNLSTVDLDNLNNKDIRNAKLRLTLLIEKVQELFQSFINHDTQYKDFDPLFNILKTKLQYLNPTTLDIDKTSIATLLADLEYINNGTAVWLDIPLQDCFLEVHKTNMKKLDKFTGKPIYREDGKILYDSSYTPPNIESIIGSDTPL